MKVWMVTFHDMGAYAWKIFATRELAEAYKNSWAGEPVDLELHVQTVLTKLPVDPEVSSGKRLDL